MKITFDTLREVAESKRILRFVQVCEIKTKFKNSCIYKNTIKNPSSFGWSRTKLNEFIKYCINNDWGFYRNQNFILKSAIKINELYTQRKFKKYITIQTKDDIYFELLKNRLRQKDFDDRKKTDFNYSASSRKVKSAIKYLKRCERSFPDGEDKIKIDKGISLATIAATFNMSVSSTHGILKTLLKKGLISIKTRFENFGKFNLSYFKSLQLIYKGVFKNKYNTIIKLNTSIITILNKPFEGKETLVCN